MAKTLFHIPADIELFSMQELDRILHCARTKRDELIRAGEITVVTVAGKRLAKGRSVRAYLDNCDSKPSGRSLSAQALNRSQRAVRA